MSYHISSKDFLVGATVGSLLGTVTALLMAPKSGKKTRHDIYETYSDLSERTHEAAERASDATNKFTKSFTHQAGDFIDVAKNLYDDVRGWISPEPEFKKDTTTGLLIGSLAGGIIGAAVGLLLAPKAGTELRRDIADTYENISEKGHDIASQLSKRGKAFSRSAHTQTNQWLNLAEEIVGYLTKETKEAAEELNERSDEFQEGVGDKFKNAFELASLGVRLWQQIKRRG